MNSTSNFEDEVIAWAGGVPHMPRWDKKPFFEEPFSKELLSQFHPDFYYKWRRINQLIKNADPGICLTSNYEYIRECKRYYLESSNES